MAVARRALGAQRAARRDQHRRTEIERAAQEASTATARVVDHELLRRQWIRERNVAEQVALAEELDAIALVVVAVGRSFRSRHQRARQPIGGPVGFAALLGRVAEDEPAAALTARVHDGPLRRRRELLEHLVA